MNTPTHTPVTATAANTAATTAANPEVSAAAAPGADAPTTGWTAICALTDILPLGARRVERARGMPVAVFRSADDQVHALLDRCPHKGGPLSQGIVFGHSVACPLHNWTIELVDGQARAPDEGCTPVFACKVEDGTVYLDAAELAGHALDLTAPVAGPCHNPRRG